MALRFQKSVVDSRVTFPLVSLLSLSLWFILPLRQDAPPFDSADYGLWGFVSPFVADPVWTRLGSAVLGLLSLYLMAELNNSRVLLRINSRMLATFLIAFQGIVLSCHTLHPGGVVMVCALAAAFPLFVVGDMPAASSSFAIHLPLAIGSLVFPKLLWLVPVYWVFQSYLRKMTPRCLAASLLAVVFPYWIAGGVSVLADRGGQFLEHLLAVVDVVPPDYGSCAAPDLIVFGFFVLLFVVGAVDFYANQYQDRVRTRTLYNIVIAHGICIILFLVLLPQFFWAILPLFLIDTATLFGHFFTFTHTPLSHILCILLLVLAVLVVLAQFMLDDLVEAAELIFNF